MKNATANRASGRHRSTDAPSTPASSDTTRGAKRTLRGPRSRRSARGERQGDARPPRQSATCARHPPLNTAVARRTTTARRGGSPHRSPREAPRSHRAHFAWSAFTRRFEPREQPRRRQKDGRRDDDKHDADQSASSHEGCELQNGLSQRRNRHHPVWTSWTPLVRSSTATNVALAAPPFRVPTCAP